MAQIAESDFPAHYKNLRHRLKEYRRAHINGNLVLLFRIEEGIIIFEDLVTHDEAYRR